MRLAPAAGAWLYRDSLMQRMRRAVRENRADLRERD